MVSVKDPYSTLGDMWLNACNLVPRYQAIVDGLTSHLFRWTEPFVLVTCCLVVLLLLPLIFLVPAQDAYQKMSRLYNVVRLSVLTFFHRLLYIYLIVCPMAFAFRQHPPCRGLYISNEKSFNGLYYLPSARYASFCLLMLYIWSLATATRKRYSWVFPLIMVLFGVNMLFTGDLSVAQGVFTCSLSYALHFYAMRIPFWFLHVENVVLPLILFLSLVLGRDRYFNDSEALGRVVAGFSLWIADGFMLGRYHYSRAGFVSIGRPIDLEWEADSKSSAYFSILSSDGEDAFSSNLVTDLVDSIVAMCIYAAGLILRQIVGGAVRSSSSGLI